MGFQCRYGRFLIRCLGAVLIFARSTAVAFAVGMLTPYLLASWKANIPVLAVCAVASFALLACSGTVVAPAAG